MLTYSELEIINILADSVTSENYMDKVKFLIFEKYNKT